MIIYEILKLITWIIIALLNINHYSIRHIIALCTLYLGLCMNEIIEEIRRK